MYTDRIGFRQGVPLGQEYPNHTQSQQTPPADCQQTPPGSGAVAAAPDQLANLATESSNRGAWQHSQLGWLGGVASTSLGLLAKLDRTGYFDPITEGARVCCGWETKRSQSEAVLSAWTDAPGISPQEREERVGVAELIRWRAGKHDVLRVHGELDLSNLKLITELPQRLHVGGTLRLKNCAALTHLPKHFCVGFLFITHCDALVCLPEGLSTGGANIFDCKSLTHLARRFSAPFVDLRNCPAITHLADDFKYCQNLYVQNCPAFARLPKNFVCRSQMTLSGCAALTELPGDMIFPSITHLYDCRSLRYLPAQPRVGRGSCLSFRDCVSLARLPDDMTVLSLSIHGCKSLTALPKGLTTTYLRLDDCGLTGFPEDLGLGDAFIYDNLPFLRDIPLALLERLEAGTKQFVFNLEHTGVSAQAQQELRAWAAQRGGCSQVRLLFSEPEQTGRPGAAETNHQGDAQQTWMSGAAGVGKAFLATLDRTGVLKPVSEGIRVCRGWETNAAKAEAILKAWADAAAISPQEHAERARVAEGIRWQAKKQDVLHVRGNLELSDLKFVTKLPQRLQIDGTLRLKNCRALAHLPAELCARDIYVDGCNALLCLPEGLKLTGLKVHNSASFTHVAHQFTARYIDLKDCAALTHLAEDFKHCHNLYLYNCPALTHLPKDFGCRDQMTLEDCLSLKELPENMALAACTELRNCRSLTHLPQRLNIVENVTFELRNCDSLTRLSENLKLLDLEIIGCKSLKELPQGLRVERYLRIEDSNIAQLPDDLEPAEKCKIIGLPWLKDFSASMLGRLEAGTKKYILTLEKTGISAETKRALVAAHRPTSNVRFVFSGSPQQRPAAPVVSALHQTGEQVQGTRPRAQADKIDIDEEDVKRNFEAFSAQRARDNQSAFGDVTGPLAQARDRAVTLRAVGRDLEERIEQARALRESTAAIIEAAQRKPRKPDYYFEDRGRQREMIESLRRRDRL